jgi:hypothetical protein
VYAQLAYNRCIFFVPGPDVGGALYEEMDVDDRYGPGEPQASGDSTKGGGVAGGKAAKWGIVDHVGRESDGREGGNVGIKAG